jgi:hypothetical protein
MPEGIYSKDGRIGFSNGFSFHFTLLFFLIGFYGRFAVFCRLFDNKGT